MKKEKEGMGSKGNVLFWVRDDSDLGCKVMEATVKKKKKTWGW